MITRIGKYTLIIIRRHIPTKVVVNDVIELRKVINTMSLADRSVLYNLVGKRNYLALR